MIAGYRLFDQAIEEAVEAGMIRSLPIMNVTNIIVSTCTMTSSLSVLMDEVYEVDITREEYLSSFSDSLVEVLFKGLEAKRPELEGRRR